MDELRGTSENGSAETQPPTPQSNATTTMPTESNAHPNSVNGRLADNLDAQREAIVNEWLTRVRGDSTIPTDSLTTPQLKDHLPQLFDDLVSTLRRYGSEAVAEKSESDGEEHGATRWQQGFELPEMLRELMHLRTILIYHLRVFEEHNEDFGMAARLFVSSTLHRFLDEMGIDATKQFLTQGVLEQKAA